MRQYTSIHEINQDLKRLNLERKIAWEQMKGLKYDVKEDFSPYNWVNTIISALKKYGILYLIRRILK